MNRSWRILWALTAAVAIAMGAGWTAHADDDDDDDEPGHGSSVESWPPTEISWPPLTIRTKDELAPSSKLRP